MKITLCKVMGKNPKLIPEIDFSKTKLMLIDKREILYN